MRSLYLCFVLIYLQIHTGYSTDLIVKCPAGRFAGHYHVTSDGVRVVRYLGIPYAAPPLGARRFAKPQLIESLKGVFSASQHGPSCLQTNELSSQFKVYRTDDETEASEDCLTLNIYLPDGSSKGSDHAVMVWLHGGGFQWGGSIRSPADNIAANNVIVVTLNYRLGVFGFLATTDSEIPGNYGLWDQHVALQWIQNNIEFFGGSREKVTLFGNSAGGAATTFQGLFKGNKNLFQRVIAQSGVMAAKWASSKDVPTYSEELAGYLNCNITSAAHFLSCTREANSSYILSAVQRLHVNNGMSFAFMPRYDGDFVNYNPFTVLKNPRLLSEVPWLDKDFMTGINNIDGYMFVHIGLSEMAPMFLHAGLSKDIYADYMLPKAMEFVFDHEHFADLIPLFEHQYTDWTNTSSDTGRLKQYSSLTTDLMFTAHAAETLRAHAGSKKSSRTYSYYFEHILPWSKVKSSVVFGTNHGDEVPYIFGFPNVPEKDITSVEKKYTKIVMEYWTNFAISGNPNLPNKKYIQHSWPQFDNKEESYLDFSQKASDISAKRRLLPDRVAFWLELLPKMMKISEGNEPPPPCYAIPIPTVSAASRTIFSGHLLVLFVIVVNCFLSCV